MAGGAAKWPKLLWQPSTFRHFYCFRFIRFRDILEMDKYYLSKLPEIHEGINLERRAKFVEINYSRKPPSFGIVYLHDEQQQQQLRLACLELLENQNAKFSTIKCVNLSAKLGSRIVADFDVSNSMIILDESQRRFAIQCILLTKDGNLLTINLIDESVESAKGTTEASSKPLTINKEASYLQCKLQQTEEAQLVHLISDRQYYCKQLSQSTLDLLGSYSGANSKITKMHVSYVADGRILLELEDFTLVVLHNFKCIASLKLDEFNMSAVVYNSTCSDETIILTLDGTHLKAHHLQINESNLHRPNNKNELHLLRDPDQILSKEPTFELELCWSIDLSDIDCIRALAEDDEFSQDQSPMGCLQLMWSPSQSNFDSKRWPKFLIITYKYYLLVYSFEQQPIVPFSVVYDKSFLKVVPIIEEGLNKSASDPHQEFLDPKQKPKLIQNFKLIGTQPTDSLFNTLFLASKIKIISCRHFAQLGLSVGLSNSGDILAFKMTSSKIVDNKDSVYQQLVADSLKGNSILNQQLDRLLETNGQIREDLQNLEDKLNNRSSAKPEVIFDNLHSHCNVEMKHNDNLACSYDLEISWLNLTQVGQIVVLSTVNCFILEPLDTGGIEYAEINNGNSSKDKAINMLNLGLNRIKSMESGSTLTTNRSRHIVSWAVITLTEKLDSKIRSLLLPILIMDGQFGELRIFFIFRNGSTFLNNHLTPRLIKLNEQQINLSAHNPVSQSGNELEYHSERIEIKPMLSYKPTSEIPDDNADKKFTILGDFTKEKLEHWLSELLDTTGGESQVKLFSNYTRCSLEYKVANREAILRSEDIMALDIIKRHLLTQATNESIELQLSNFNLTTCHLKNMFAQQYIAVKNVDKRLKLSQKGGIDLNDSLDLDEISLSQSDEIKRDLEDILAKKNVPVVENENHALEIYKDLLASSLCDILINFGESNGSSLMCINKDMKLELRSKLSEIFKNVQILSEQEFVETVMKTDFIKSVTSPV